MNIRYRLQLVSKQVDLKGDGILGHDFLAAVRARICYRETVLIFRYKGVLVRRKLMSLPGAEQGTPRDRVVNKLTLPPRTELIVQVPVDIGPQVQEGTVERAELMPGVYMADSLVTVAKGCVLTNISNTTEDDVELFDPVVKLEELGDSDTGEAAIMGVTEQGEDRGDQNLSRGERVIAKLRDEHLNEEEKKLLRAVCVEYQDVFYLPGDKLSCTNAATHSIQLEPGVTPINTQPYRLPGSQKEQIDRQVRKLAEDGIITKSDFPWNRPLLTFWRRNYFF